jgi:DNA processing protein
MPYLTTRADAEDWLWLSLLPNVGSARIQKLLNHFGSAKAVRVAAEHELVQVLGARAATAIREFDGEAQIRIALDWLVEPTNHLITIDTPDYPALLREIPDPPVLLYGKGRRAFLERQCVAVVGSRNATQSGSETAARFAEALSASGLTVVSGLALGIDAAAHRGALDAAGSTIAVVGTGLDRVYPARNAALAREIAEKGLLLSEQPLGTPPLAENFPQRNRIISGLSLGVLVVEAAIASGSLITARCAADQGRDVFAIPGSIHSPLSRGGHGLIKQGAKLVEDAADVLRELGWLGMAVGSGVSSVDDESELPSTIRDAIGFDPFSVDELAVRTGESAPVLMGKLSLWEIEGIISQLPGGRFQRVR